MLTNGFRNRFYTGMILLPLIALGCGKAPQPKDKAERALEEFLAAWSRGEPPDQFADANRPIQGADPDWKTGHRLLSFLCADAKQSEEAPDHVRCRVALSLQDKKGKRLNKDVVYDVQLGDKCVLSRVSP
jgi:hypothetical protein